jgi:hypothetical protein
LAALHLLYICKTKQKTKQKQNNHNKYMLSSFRYITEMAGADEKAIVLDELIQVAKYSNMRKTKSTQPDHDTECIKPSQLYNFYFANMDLILWLTTEIPLKLLSLQTFLPCWGN